MLPSANHQPLSGAPVQRSGQFGWCVFVSASEPQAKNNLAPSVVLA